MVVLAQLTLFSGQTQTTIWSEDFSGYSNGTTTGANNNTPPATSDWTTSCSTCNLSSEFRVDGGQFHVENTDEYAVWTSETISISGYSNVSISVEIDMDDNQFDATDCINLYYNVDGGGNTLFSTNGSLCDDGSDPTFATQTGLSGTSLVIVITAQTTNTNEDLYFDNIEVTGETPLGKDGPGGVGDTDGSGALVLWFDANTISQSDNTNLNSWTDASGYGNNASTPGNSPSFQTNVRNGFPAVEFDENNTEYMRVADDASLRPNTLTAMVMGTFTNGSDAYSPFLIKTDNYQDWSQGYGIARNNSTDDIIGFVTEWDVNFITSDLAYNDPTIITLDYDKTNVELYFDGTSQGTDNYSSNITNTTNYLYLGISPNGTSGNGTGVRNSLDGDIYEAIIYNQSLNSAQRNIVHNYLAAKYGQTLGGGTDLYDEDNFGYDYEVAGIGQEADGSHEDAQGTGIVRVQSPSGLGNGEYLIWGHDNEALDSWGVTDLPATIQSRLARDWSASETGEVGTVTVSFDLNNVAGSITTADLRLLVDGNGTYSSGATLHSGATHLGSNVYQWTGIDIDNNDHFTVGSINVSQTPLPVELVEFSATPNLEEKVIDLFWITASESNNDFFTVERTKDLKDFEEVMQVSGQGTTNERTEYHETDYEPFQGVSFYRLSQTDFNGKTKYFELEKVLLDIGTSEKDLEVHLYPNPNEGHNMYVKIPSSDQEELNVLVNDFLGKEFLVDFTVINQGEYSVVAIEMNQKLPQGSYMVSVQVGDKIHTHKLIVR